MKHIYRLLRVLFAFAIAAPVLAQTSLPEDKVIASNQYVTVTYAEFLAELARIPERDQFEFLLDRLKLARMVDNALLNKTLAIEARRNKLDALPKAQAEIRNQTDKVLAKYRGQQFQDELPKIDLASRARETFLTNPERFISPELHDTSHLLVAIKDRTRDQAKSRAEAIRARLIAGESIETLAVELSDDPSVSRNKGRLGLLPLSTFEERYGAAIRMLKAGDISPVFETSYGFHVAKLHSVTPAKKQPFEYFKEALMQEADTQYRAGRWEQYLKSILNDPKLFVDKAALEAIRPVLPPVPPLAQSSAPTK